MNMPTLEDQYDDEGSALCYCCGDEIVLQPGEACPMCQEEIDNA